MANYKKLRLFYDRWNDKLLDARGLPVKRLDVIRGDIYQVELQVFDGGQFAVDSDGLIDSAVAVDLTDYTNIVLGLKTQALYTADGAFSLAMAGFDLTNPVHSLVAGRAAMLALFSASPADYYTELELRTTAGNPFSAMSRPTVATVHRDVVIGTETNMPSGVTAVIFGNASIENAASASDPVAVSGMTATGQVILGFLAPTGSPTEPTYWVSYAAGAFTIHTSVAPGAGNAYNFRWTLVRLS
jgi:hypothetical protein